MQRIIHFIFLTSFTNSLFSLLLQQLLKFDFLSITPRVTTSVVSTVSTLPHRLALQFRHPPCPCSFKFHPAATALPNVLTLLLPTRPFPPPPSAVHFLHLPATPSLNDDINHQWRHAGDPAAATTTRTTWSTVDVEDDVSGIRGTCRVAPVLRLYRILQQIRGANSNTDLDRSIGIEVQGVLKARLTGSCHSPL